MYTVKLKCILLLILGLSVCFDEAFAHKKVRLQEVQALTLNRGQYTTGRRNSPVPQLKCVGGSAHGQYTPAVVQCYNRGFDGSDVQWECSASMPKEYEFGKISVSCEGFDYPDDPYILYGSCGLEYELNNAQLGSASYAKRTPTAPPEEDEESSLKPIVYFAIVCFVMYLLYLVLSGPTPGQEGDRDRHGGGYGYGGGPDDGRRPPPPGFRGYPPSYDDATKGTYTSSNSTGPGFANYAPNQAQGPGFFSGLGAGALAGYFFGNRNNANAGPRYRGNYARQAFHDDYAHDEPGPSRSSGGSFGGRSGGGGSTHTSTSFGGTSRR